MDTVGNQVRIRAAVVREKKGPFRLEELQLDNRLRPDEVLVRIVASGVCQTDAHARNQEYAVPLPLVLGHEGAGVVEKVGDAVTSVRRGDRVVMSYPACGHCAACLQGQPAYCISSFPLAFGGARLDGTSALSRNVPGGSPETIHGHFFAQSSFATSAIATERNVVKVPDSVPLELMAPLGCGLQTGAGAVFNSLKVPAGASLAIFGTGAVGLAAVMAARIVGATSIIAVDVNDARLDLAGSLGATHVINGAKEDVRKRITELTGAGVDYVLEMTALPRMLKLAVDVLASRGVAALIGGAPTGTEAAVDMNTLLNGGRTLRGVIQGDSVPQLFIPKLVEFYRAGRFPFDRLVRYYDFEDINRAFDETRSGATIKPVLRIGSVEEASKP
jgi:aryl-alcohol dehydrogenase